MSKIGEDIVSEISSIGVNWPPVPASNHRVRGFHDSLIESTGDAMAFAEQFRGYAEEVEQHPEWSRLVIRAAVHTGLLAPLEDAGVPLEAALPIRDCDDVVIVYAAHNCKDRVVDEATLHRHGAMLSAIASAPREAKDIHQVLEEQGLTPKIISSSTPIPHKRDLIDRFTALYGTFGYNGVEVEDLLMSPTNTIAYVEDERGVVSTAMAEKAHIPIKGLRIIEMTEITEAVTRVEDRGKGLYRAVSGHLVRGLLEEGSSDIVYGESNVAMKGVLIAAHENGRRFSYFDGTALGIRDPHFGFLRQNFHVEDGAERRRFNDFALSYQPLG